MLVVDESQLFIESIDKMNNGEDLVFKPMIESIPLDSIKKTYESLGYDALLYIPSMDIENPNFLHIWLFLLICEIKISFIVGITSEKPFISNPLLIKPLSNSFGD